MLCNTYSYQGGLGKKTPSKLSAGDEGEHGANKSKLPTGVEGERVCTEFKQAKYPHHSLSK